MILEREYHHALAVLAPDPQRANRNQLARAFILLCAFRCGLRGSEATGLLRRDWVETQDGSVVVLVRNNALRKLKTPSGRRQVPLLFELTSFERKVINRLFALWDSVSQGDDALPLLIDPDNPSQLLDEKRLRMEVGNVIKTVTMNPLLSLHHARHAFANRVGTLLFDRAEAVWTHAAQPAGRAPSRDDASRRRAHVRRLLLGTELTTRRSSWALARLLGHAHPRTSFRSYVHFLPEWLADWVGFAEESPDASGSGELTQLLDLDELPTATGYLQAAPQSALEATTQPLSLDKILRFLRRYQDGVPCARAAEGAEIEQADAKVIAESIRRIDIILQRREAVNRGLGGTTNLLSHIPARRWDALRDWLRSRSPEVPSGTLASAAIEQILNEMIGPSRQLLLWKREHFLWFARAIGQLGLNASQFLFVSASTGHEKMTLWAEEAELAIPQPRPDKHLQVDTVELGDPPVRIKHRIAVVPDTAKSSLFESTYEFVAIMVLVMISLTTQPDPSADASMRTKV
jgi:integrase